MVNYAHTAILAVLLYWIIKQLMRLLQLFPQAIERVRGRGLAADFRVFIVQIIAMEQEIERGQVPSPPIMEALRSMEGEAAAAAFQAVCRELRERGAPLLEFIRSYRMDLTKSLDLHHQSQAKVTPVITQMAILIAMVPVFSVFLSFILDLTDLQWATYGSVCVVAFLYSFIGYIDLAWICERAVFLGISKEHRRLFFLDEAVVTTFLSLVRSGEVPLIAWHSTLRCLRISGEDAKEWPLLEKFLLETKESIQIAVMTGSRVTELVSSQLALHRSEKNRELLTNIDRLPLLALRSLIFFVVPAVFIVLGLGVYMWGSQIV